MLEQPLFRPGPTVDETAAVDRPGTVIGPYKLLEPIGEGGMGTVWMAQQTQPVKRLVAVKLIKAGMDSKQVIARFEAERQALALMDHPNIARVLDAGTTGSGRPYFVMDLVKGVPITRYCDEHRLTPRQRLELFVPVCQAVQHAHQKGIIHRDLKPSNILVAPFDGKPVVKVIDFGVAKAAGQQLTDLTLVTGFGNVVGTLEYMSPEQAELNNQDIDTRSDIYSLGVLLYELLAGSPPFTRKELEKVGMVEMLRVIREQEPSKPSTKLSTAEGLPTLAANRGTEPAKLTRLVQGELDWIVMKALDKDRNRRYETANGFAMDVQRYLADEQVLACPPSVGYRLRKFARRNKTGLVVAALVLFFFVLLGSGAGWVVRDRSAREAEAVRQQEERQAKVAGAVESIFAEVDRLEKAQKWPEALEAARRAEAAVAGGEADPATAERVHQRLRDLEFIDRLERIRMERATLVAGKFNNAGADRDYARAFREYGVDVHELPVEDSVRRLRARPALAVALAAGLDDWVHNRRTLSEADTARWKRLVAVARGIDPEPLRDRLRAAWGQPVAIVRDDLRRLADSIDVRAQHPATLILLWRTLMRAQHRDSALRILRDAQYLHPADFWLNYHLAFDLHLQRDYEGAGRFYTMAIAIHPNSAAAHNNLGITLYLQNKFDEAISTYRKAIEVDPTYPWPYIGLGDVLRAQEKYEEAIAACHKAIQVDQKNSNAYLCLGNILHAQKKYDEAIAACRKAIELNPNDPRAHYLRRAALMDQGKLEEARAAWEQILEQGPSYHDAWYGYAELCLFLGKEDAYRRNRTALLKRFGKTTDPVVAERTARACLLLPASGEELEQAAALADRAVTLGKDHLSFGWFLAAKALAEYRLGRFESALDWGQKAGAKGNWVPTHLVLAMAHRQLGHAEEARRSLDEAVKTYDWKDRNGCIHTLRREADNLLVPHLAAFLRGQHQPHDNKDRFELIGPCLFQTRYLTAAHLYQGAFAADPKPAEDLNALHRYHAARAASLAGCGQGKDADKLDDKERSLWRGQALEWLRLDLAAWTQLAADAKEHRHINRMLQQWQRERDLAGLRDAEALKKLPAEEQKACRDFWALVARLDERTMLVTPWRDSDTWVVKGQEVHHPDGTNYHLLLFGDPRWTDYDFEAEINVAGAGEVGLVLRATGPGNYVKAVCSSNEKWNGIVGLPEGSNTWWILAQGQDGTTPLTKDRWYPMRVEVRGNTFKMYLDGKLLASVSSDQYPRGCVGLTTTNCTARFRNVKVTDPSGKVLLEGVQNVLPKSMP
jgi:serine/threonine-protein kinase